MKELKDMTVAESEAYKAELYKVNSENGNINKLYTICRMLGVDVAHNWGPKYIYKEGPIEIYVDDYGNYMTLKIAGKERVSTHACDKLYSPGDWEEIIDRLYPAAQDKLNAQIANQNDKRKDDLLNQLSYSSPL